MKGWRGGFFYNGRSVGDWVGIGRSVKRQAVGSGEMVTELVPTCTQKLLEFLELYKQPICCDSIHWYCGPLGDAPKRNHPELTIKILTIPFFSFPSETAFLLLLLIGLVFFMLVILDAWVLLVTRGGIQLWSAMHNLVSQSELAQFMPNSNLYTGKPQLELDPKYLNIPGWTRPELQIPHPSTIQVELGWLVLGQYSIFGFGLLFGGPKI